MTTKGKICNAALNNFISSSLVNPVVGAELEFYLLNRDGLQIAESQGSIVDDFISELQNVLAQSQSASLVYAVERERGVGQIEVKFIHQQDLLEFCLQVEAVKVLVSNLARERDLLASFASQPFQNDCGSALQFNISLHDSDGKNLFSSKEKMLLSSIHSLLKHSDKMLILMAPRPEDYLRFDYELNLALHKKGKFTAPVNLSFGENNRTAAIRIPSHGSRRIEYRMASANADPYLSLAAILLVLSEKNEFEENEFPEIYGNAFDSQYQVPSFAKSYSEALTNFNSDKNFVREGLKNL